MAEACYACSEAELHPRTYGGYRATCWQCDARMLAHSPAAKDALLGHPQALQAAMLKLWTSAEQYRRGRVEVHRWIRLIDDAKEKT